VTEAAAGEAPASPPARLDAALDRLTAEHTGETATVLAARQEYEERRGKVHEDEDLWERWSAAFVEWFVIERVGAGDELPPAARSLRRARGDGDADAAAIIAALLRSHRSLFEVRELGAQRVEVLDLLGGGAFSVVEPRAMHGVEVGDVVELRLVGWEGQVWFGRTFVFHPKDARAAILDHARALLARGQSRRDVIDHVAALRVRVNRYRHVAPARVYELGSRIGG
jgi:hypothetical protein